MVRCPVHDDREPSLSIKDGPAGKVLVCCHAGCDQMRVIAELRLRGLWHEKRRSSILLRPTSSSGHSAETESVLHRRRARGLWQESRSIVGTVAEKYLAKRGLLERS